MIMQTTNCFITAALLVFSLLALSACEKDPASQQPTVTAPVQKKAPAQEEAISAQETISIPQEGTILIQHLPPEAQQTLIQIYQNGPFPHDRDGAIFENREKLLPIEPSGYYREYTVPTPGAKDRGARRIVCGGKKPSDPDRCYYTADRYLSFQFIFDETANSDETTEP